MAGPRQARRAKGEGQGRAHSDCRGALLRPRSPMRCLAGAMRALDEARAKVDRISVPGSLEIPPAIAIAADAARRKRRPYDGVVALGCVIRGETIHFEIVSHQSARGLMELSVARGLPIGNGIITVENEAQAFARARMEEQDKGGDAARAALALVELKRRSGRADDARRRDQRSTQGQQARRGAACRRAGALSDGSRRYRLERDHGRVREPLARRRS